MPGWSNLMPMVIFLPPPSRPALSLSLSSEPQAVAVRASARTAAEAAVTLRSFMVNIL